MIHGITSLHYWTLAYGGPTDDICSSRLLYGAILRKKHEDLVAIFASSWSFDVISFSHRPDEILALLERNLEKAYKNVKGLKVIDISTAALLILENSRISDSRMFAWSRESDSALFNELFGPDEYVDGASHVLAAYSTSLEFKNADSDARHLINKMKPGRLLLEFDPLSRLSYQATVKAKASRRFNHVSYMTI